MSKKQKEFNYVIGTYWKGENGQIAPYMIHNSQVHFGTMRAAEAALNYAKQNSKSLNEHKIFIVKELEKE